MDGQKRHGCSFHFVNYVQNTVLDFNISKSKPTGGYNLLFALFSELNRSFIGGMDPSLDHVGVIGANGDSIAERPISVILFVIAMQAEASPLVRKFQLAEDPHAAFPKGVPWVRYYGKYKDLDINIVCPGKDSKLGVDSVGTASASILTYASIQALQPDLIINAGTAGGFKTKGACIGDVFLVSEVAFHDRRIPIPVRDIYGIGSRPALSTPNLAKELNLKVGKLSTGDSLDMSPVDEIVITANNATVKDMEGAAVAYVADLLKVPTIFLKAVTDIVDGDKPTAEEFLHNLAAVATALEQTAVQVIDFVNGKSFSEI